LMLPSDGNRKTMLAGKPKLKKDHIAAATRSDSRRRATLTDYAIRDLRRYLDLMG
jgi:hypothetical protein